MAVMAGIRASGPEGASTCQFHRLTKESKMRNIRFFTVVVTAILVVVSIVQFGPLRPSVVWAHPGVHPPSPPSYDYNTDIPGIQPPTSPLLANPATHTLRTFQLSVSSVLVPLGELQAILPPGFNALESSPGSGTASLILDFIFQERFERIGIGTFGPASGLQVRATVLNITLNRQETVLMAQEYSDPAFVAAINAANGPGSSRVAEVKAEIEEEEGQIRLKFEVEDEAIGLDVEVRGEGRSADIVQRFHVDPQVVAFRSLNNGLSPNPSFRLAVQQDRSQIAVTDSNLKLRGAGGQLRLPGGSLTLVGLGPTFNIVRWQEIFTNPEPE